MIDIGYLVYVLVIILLSMTAHEAMHAFVSYFLGDDTAKLQGRLTFNPIKHIDPIMTILLPLLLALTGGVIFGGAKPVPFNPNRLKYDEWGVALVAISGPLTNFVISFIAFGFWHFSNYDNQLASDIMQINLGFFVFNILPIPPLDGSRLLYVVAPDMVRSVMDAIERYSVVFIFILIMMMPSFIGNIMETITNFILNFFNAFYA